MDHLRITVEGKVYDVVVEKIGSETAAPAARPVSPAVVAAAASVPAPAPVSAPRTAAGAGDAVSPLTGIVQAVDVAVGAAVKEGDSIITLEAMKMYTPINAISTGTVTAIHVKVGDSVEEGQVLYTIK